MTSTKPRVAESHDAAKSVFGLAPINADHSALTTNRLHVSVEEGRAELPPGQPSTPVLMYGSLTVRYYKPRNMDIEARNQRDALYVISSGSGVFFHGAHLCGDQPRRRFSVGEVIFVPAGVVHRFECVSEDCSVWTIWYGPPGGEAAREMDGDVDGCGSDGG